MNTENTIQDHRAFPHDVTDDLGTIIHTEWQCPGVWYVANEGNGFIAGEYYIVEHDTLCISDAAKLHGTYLANHPDLLLYDLLDPEGGKGIIQYEIARYRKQHGLPLSDDNPLLATAVYAMETNPEYFGSYPAPIQTPHGILTRYQTIANGIFVLETDECERMIAICYPLWDTTLTEYTIAFGEQTAYDRQHGIDNTLGYLFFPVKHGCLALFELLIDAPEILSSPLIDPAALNNAIWQLHPEYAAIYNRGEVEGKHDAFAALLRFLGVEDVEPTVLPERLIKLTMGVGTDYLKL